MTANISRNINPELIRAGRSGFITALVALGYISQDEGIKMINDLIKQSVNERYYTTKQSDKKS